MEQGQLEAQPSIHHSFQRFSSEYGNLSSNKKALSLLQNDYGLNMNIVLFCLWMAYTGRGALTKKQVQALVGATHFWHEQIVMRLHQLANYSLKKPSAPWSQTVYQAVMVEEQVAAQIEQSLLTEVFPDLEPKSRGLQQRLIQSCKNLGLYTQEMQVFLDDRDCQSLQHILANVFPKLDDAAIHLQCNRFIRKKGKAGRGKKQLHLTL